MKRHSEKFLFFFFVSGLFGLSCFTREARSEEIVSSLSSPEALFLDGTLKTIPSLLNQINVLDEQTIFIGEEQMPFLEELPLHLPKGNEITLLILQRKLSVGKRAAGLVYHSEATVSVRAGGLRHYMAMYHPEEMYLMMTEEQKIAWGFGMAESVAEAIEALPIPIVGNLAIGLMKVGRDIEKANKKIKTHYRLHLNYSGKVFRASFKESF